MSYRELKQFKLCCNRCDESVIFTTQRYRVYDGRTELDSDHLPEGWKRKIIVRHDCGLTGYTSRDPIDLCPRCAAKEAEENSDV